MRDEHKREAQAHLSMANVLGVRSVPACNASIDGWCAHDNFHGSRISIFSAAEMCI